MTKFLGFETKEEAKKHQKKNGGELATSESKNKVNRKMYEEAVIYGGLNREKYKYVLLWYAV